MNANMEAIKSLIDQYKDDKITVTIIMANIENKSSAEFTRLATEKRMYEQFVSDLSDIVKRQSSEYSKK